MADIRALTDLTDRPARLHMLQQLVDQLDADERRALSLMVSRKNDPLSILPVELVIQIMDQVPFLDTWRFQLVGRQWHSVLSSDQVTKAALDQWDTHHPSDSAHSLESALALSIRSRIRTMQATRLGRPFAVSSFQDHPRAPYGVRLSQVERSVALKGRHLAYIFNRAHHEQHLAVRDLLSEESIFLFSTARERIMSIVLTSSIVAYMNFNGKLYIKDLLHQDSQQKTVQLPSAFVTAFTADKEICAVAFKVSDSTCSIALYDASKGALRSFDTTIIHVSGQGGRYYEAPQCILLDADQKHIDVFSHLAVSINKSNTAEDAYIEHRRYSFSGEEMASSSWQGLNLPRPTREAFRLGDLLPTGHQDIHVFRTERLRADDSSWMTLFFNAHTAQIQEHRDIVEAGQRYEDNDYTSLAHWKDVEFRLSSQPIRVRTAEGEGRYRTRNHIFLPYPTDIAPGPFTLFVNDSFLIALNHNQSSETDRIMILCFEEELPFKGMYPGHWNLDWYGKAYPQAKWLGEHGLPYQQA